jgi:hypothetical protein
MEDLGKLVARYYVVKDTGFLSKSTRLIDIHERGFTFKDPDRNKAIKGKNVCHFRDVREVVLSDRNEKEVMVKVAQQSFALICNDRLNLATDLLYWKVYLCMIIVGRKRVARERTS